MASYKKMDNGTWAVRFRYINASGEEKQTMLRGFKMKKEAEQAYADFLIKTQSHKKIKKQSLTFREVYYAYAEHYRQNNAVSSVLDFERIFKAFILPHFADKEISKIEKTDLLKWQTNLCKSDYSHMYKCKIRGFLSSFYTFANRYYDIPNIMRSVSTIKRLEPKKEMQIWSPDEFKRFLSVVTEQVYAKAFSFFYLTGVRLGELQALKWDCIDFENKTAKISRSASRKKPQGAIKGQVRYTIGKTKNASSNRVISLPQSLIMQLKELKCTSKFSTDNDYIFTLTGDCLPEQSIRNKIKQYSNVANVKPIRIHDFRHSHASVLLGSGIPVLEVSRRLGHANATQTLNTYAHLLPNSSDKIITVLDKI